MWFKRIQGASLFGPESVWEEFEQNFPQYTGIIHDAADSIWVDSYQFYRDIFLHLPWSGHYGGRPWYNIVNALEDLERKYRSGASFYVMMNALDRVFDLAHNTDSVFNKAEGWSQDQTFVKWIRQALDIKRYAVSPSMYLNKCSPEIQRLYKLHDRETTYRSWWETVKKEQPKSAISLFKAMVNSYKDGGGEQFMGLRDILNSDLMDHINIDELQQPYKTVYYFMNNYRKLIDHNFGRHTMINSLIGFIKYPTGNFPRRLIQGALDTPEMLTFIKMLSEISPDFWNFVRKEKISLEKNPNFTRLINKLNHKDWVKHVSSHVVKQAFILQSDFFDFYVLTSMDCNEFGPEDQRICQFERKRVVDAITPPIIEFLKFAIRKEATHVKDIFGLSTEF